MSSRDFTKHLVSNTSPINTRVGDEYYDPVSNKLYKKLAVDGTTVTDVEILTNSPASLADNKFTLLDDIDNTKKGQFNLSGNPTGTTTIYSLPLGLANNSTLVDLQSVQTITGSKTFSAIATSTISAASTISLTGTTTSVTSLGTSATTGTTTIGGTTQTGLITVGQSTGAQTLGLGTGATLINTTKAINIGTGGVLGSFTNINIGSSVAGAKGNTFVSTANTFVSGNLYANSVYASSFFGSVGSITTATTITPTTTTSQYEITALATAAAIAVPTGTPPVNGQKLLIRIKDNGTARALTWTTTSGGYRTIGTILPSATVASKITYIGCIYNSQDLFWDVIAVTTQD